MNNDDYLISKLISETYDESTEKEQPHPVVDLRSYFEKKLNEVEFLSVKDYVFQNNLKIESVIYNENNKCFRLSLMGTVLDFPSNWSIFKNLNSENLVYLDSELDNDFLRDIFSEVTGESVNLAFYRIKNEFKLILLPEENSNEHVKWFRGYFEKNNNVQEAA
jgi:hypothetical protein